MPKSLNRLIALVLIPCLFVEPVLAGALPHAYPPAQSCQRQTNYFLRQALSEPGFARSLGRPQFSIMAPSIVALMVIGFLAVKNPNVMIGMEAMMVLGISHIKNRKRKKTALTVAELRTALDSIEQEANQLAQEKRPENVIARMLVGHLSQLMQSNLLELGQVLGEREGDQFTKFKQSPTGAMFTATLKLQEARFRRSKMGNEEKTIEQNAAEKWASMNAATQLERIVLSSLPSGYLRVLVNKWAPRLIVSQNEAKVKMYMLQCLYLDAIEQEVEPADLSALRGPFAKRARKLADDFRQLLFKDPVFQERFRQISRVLEEMPDVDASTALIQLGLSSTAPTHSGYGKKPIGTFRDPLIRGLKQMQTPRLTSAEPAAGEQRVIADPSQPAWTRDPFWVNVNQTVTQHRRLTENRVSVKSYLAWLFLRLSPKPLELSGSNVAKIFGIASLPEAEIRLREMRDEGLIERTRKAKGQIPGRYEIKKMKGLLRLAKRLKNLSLVVILILAGTPLLSAANDAVWTPVRLGRVNAFSGHAILHAA